MSNNIDYERVARRYCQLMEIDPDELVPHGAFPNPDGTVNAVLLHSPRWQTVIPSVKHILNVLTVFKEEGVI